MTSPRQPILTRPTKTLQQSHLGFSPEINQRVHQNRLLQLAREGAQSAVYQFKEYEQDRRHGSLVALMVETAATLTDEILELHDRLTHHVHILEMNGDSFRLKQSRRKRTPNS